uniref:Uncharacterized protein n=1 Tax=Pithovirus LCPAC104 TaxID=2506589 RepID=A0A481Z3Y7_9VIRU|nr:MAG: uncharacterized protein LCPAC104_01140 [Pithovirus LCPAC104]
MSLKKIFDVEKTIASLESYTLERLLFEKGFILLEKIIIKDENNFYKTLNNNGEKIIIEIDINLEEKEITSIPDKDNKIFIKSKKASIIPYSFRQGIEYCVDNDISCGVVLQCDKEFCIFKRHGDEIKPREVIFSEEDNFSEVKNFSTEKLIVTYPIVQLSKLLSNTDEVSNSLSIIYKRLLDLKLIRCDKESKDLEKRFNDMILKFSKTTVTINLAFVKLGNSLDELNKIKKFRNINKENKKKILFNQARRNELMEDLLKVCGFFHDNSINNINSISNTSDSIVKFLDDNFSDLDYIME